MPTSLSTLVDARAIVLLQDGRTRLWHQVRPEPVSDQSLEALVEAQHAANFVLWHAEDEARRPSADDASIVAVKREIDRVNQIRNDTGERIDACLLASLRTASLAERGDQHSETPGMMMDRLSILSLKLFHTQEELDRVAAPPGHRERNAERLAALQEQRNDLAGCLDRVWTQVCAGCGVMRLLRRRMNQPPRLSRV